MPGFDRTGPAGQGSMTGRRMGACAENDFRNSANFGFNEGRGFGRGFQRRFARNSGMGYGFGFRHGFGNRNFNDTQNISDKAQIENEIDILKNQLAVLEQQLSKTKGE
jgi:hypothetical protein